MKVTKKCGMIGNERLSIRGKITFKVIRADGTIEVRIIENLVVNYGTALMASLLSGIYTADQIQYLALGTDATAPTVTDTALAAELYRKQSTIELGTGADENKVTFQSTWTAGTAAGTLREAGLFDAISAGNMFSRSTFADLVISGADTLIATWEIIFAGV